MDREKFVDESWKELAAKEKEILKKTSSGKNPRSSNAKLHGVGHVNEEENSLEEQAGEEGSSGGSQSEQEQSSTIMNFLNYLSSLVYQAAIFLGEMPHPVTQQVDKNLEQAKLIIDTLIMLREKTKGNLTKKESDFLNTSIYELQMKYLENGPQSKN